jgi:anti-sigma factor RsiW
MIDCTTYAPMLTARRGELTPDEESRLHAHLAGCDACQARLADDRAVDGMVADALARAAARRDFSEFSTQVMARLPAGAWKPDPADRGEPGAEPAGPLGRLRAWARRHKLAAALAALAPAAAAVALFVWLERADPSAAAGEPGVEVTSEILTPIVLDTSDGPMILFDGGGEGT